MHGLEIYFKYIIKTWQEKMLVYLENNGYPFARIELDSINIEDGIVQAMLKIEKGPLYKIDSVRNNGRANISNRYLQRYLNIPNGRFWIGKSLAGWFALSTQLFSAGSCVAFI